jgi:preprotein translocase subunit SecE
MADELAIRKNTLERVRDYISDVRIEMKRVTWPSKQEVYGTTVMVVLSTFLFAIYFYACDELFSYVVARTLRFFTHRS